MKLGEKILKVLRQTYEADTLIERHVGRQALAFQTDSFGRPVLLFLGKPGEHGIKGKRYTRHLVTDAAGKVIKDHWDHKGKAS